MIKADRLSQMTRAKVMVVMKEIRLFDDAFIFESDLRAMNPWWEGKPGPALPPYRRWAFGAIVRKMASNLAKVTVLKGPRQVGKTTLQQQIIEHLITDKGVDPKRILRVQFDELPSLMKKASEPILAIVDWHQKHIFGQTLNEAARAGQEAYLFFDEVQNVADWAVQVKFLVDHNTAKVLVTGSSSLRIEAGRDSLAGRIADIELGTLLLREISGLRFGQSVEPLLINGLESLARQDFWIEAREHGLRQAKIRDQAFRAFSELGAYPMAQANASTPWPEIADQLNETVIHRAIRHDLRMGERGQKRNENLLEEVYRLACRYAGQTPGQATLVREIHEALKSNVGWQSILSYLKFLDGALLLKLIPPLELRLKRRKGYPKLCLCDHGLRASWLQEIIPLTAEALDRAPHLSDLAGHIVESVIGYYLAGIPGLDLATFPERGAEPEVDFVLTVGEKRIPLEVKYRSRIDPMRDTLGLRAFIEKSVYNAPFGILVTRDDGVRIDDPRIVAISLPSLLMMR
jgi:predicted AAA+ superfamily ATPase